MLAIQTFSNKIQDLLGSKYLVYPYQVFNRKYTTATNEVDMYGNQVIKYTNEYTTLRKNHIMCAVSFINPNRANSGIYYYTANFSMDCSVPFNILKTNKQGDLIETPEFNFMTDIESLQTATLNKIVSFGTTLKGKFVVNEPTFKAKESDGEIEYAIFNVSGTLVLTDNGYFGSEYEVYFKIANDYIKLDDVNNFTEFYNTDTSAIAKSGTIKVSQGLGQLNWGCNFTIDDIKTTNSARLLIYDAVHKYTEILNSLGATENLKRKVEVKIVTPQQYTHTYNATMSIDFETSKNGIGVYSVTLVEE